MGWYNVVKPCVVGQLHYARPTVQPIEVDDEVAAPLVEAGSLTPYPAVTASEIDASTSEIDSDGDQEPPAEPPAPPARGRRRTEG